MLTPLRPHFRTALLGAAMLGSFATEQARAATWDSDGKKNTNGSNTDGNGNWSATNWYRGSGNDVAWRAGDTASFGSGTATTSSFTVTVDSNFTVGGLIFNQLGSGAFYTLSGTGALTMNAGTVIDVNNTGGAAISAVLAGSNGVALSGPGALTLSGANTYSGGTTIKDGTTLIGISNVANTSGALGISTSVVTLGDSSGSAAASLLTNGAFTLSNAITAAAGSTGTLTLGGNTANASTFSGVVTLNNNLTLSQVLGGTTVFSGNISAGTSGNKTITFTNAGTVSQSDGVISNGLGTVALTQSGSGSTTLSGANTYTGITTVSAGTLEVTTLANGGSASGIGQSSNAASNLIISGGGTLAYTGSANASTDRNFTVTGTGDAKIAVNGAGSVDFTNTGNVAYGTADQARTIALAGTNAGANTFRLKITDNGTAAVMLKKIGSGKWILTNSHTHTGGTSIEEGLLVLLGAIANGPTTVNSGAILAGTGTAGAITLHSGASLAPGTAVTGDIGTLNAGALLWNGGAAMKFDLGAAGAADKLALTGAFTKGTSGGYIFDFGGTGSAGSYTLVTANSISGFMASDFTLNNLAAGFSGNVSIQGGSLVLSVIDVTAVPESEYITGVAALAALVALKRRRKAA